MEPTTVKVFKFDTGSPTDRTLERMRSKLGASTLLETMRRSLVIADVVTDYIEAGRRVYVQDDDGVLHQLLIT